MNWFAVMATLGGVTTFSMMWVAIAAYVEGNDTKLWVKIAFFVGLVLFALGVGGLNA